VVVGEIKEQPKIVHKLDPSKLKLEHDVLLQVLLGLHSSSSSFDQQMKKMIAILPPDETFPNFNYDQQYKKYAPKTERRFHALIRHSR
jgi:hypothetical protein